jgi:nucleotide-binding universal stress UspA family protein
MAGAEIAATLARHGVKVTVVRQEADHLPASAAIENRLSDSSIDLLVMGAYSHKRWWEMLFGGVTRTVLESMTALTLLSR